MRGIDAGFHAGNVSVAATQNRGHPPEFWVERAIERIIKVSNECHPLLRDQAQAFKENVQQVMLETMQRCIASDRSTVAGLLERQGHKDMAEIIRRL
jgi:hypothetical protein